MNFLHRGALTFDTLVYDTNVGDIRLQKILCSFYKFVLSKKQNIFYSPLDSYFNRERVSLDEIHEKYGHNGQVKFTIYIGVREYTYTGELPPNMNILQVCEDECYLHGSRGGQRNKNQVNFFSDKVARLYSKKEK